MNSRTGIMRINSAAAALWASAFVIAAIVIVQAGRLPGNAAHAGMVTDRASFTLMTADSGRGGDEDPDEILYVIDSREQVLLVYDIEDPRNGQIILRDGAALSEMFLRARR